MTDELEELDLLSAIWILAANDENHIITFEGIRERLGLSPEYDVHRLILKRRELFRPGASAAELEQWKADMREGRRLPAWLRMLDGDDHRKRTIDKLSQDDVFRSQFRAGRGTPPSPIAVVDWGLQHLDRLRKGRIAASEATAKSWQMWLVFAVGVLSIVVSIVMPLFQVPIYTARPAPAGSVSQPSESGVVSQQVDLAQLFLVATSIFAVALADARNEKLKTGLSLAGIVVAIAWGLCAWSFGRTQSLHETVLAVLPGLAFAGWLVSTVIHACKWSGGKTEQ